MLITVCIFQNWISYGYSLVDRDNDEWVHHVMMFAVITVVFCGGTFFFAYFPDFKLVLLSTN